jgi:hypothetical protein
LPIVQNPANKEPYHGDGGGRRRSYVSSPGSGGTSGTFASTTWNLSRSPRQGLLGIALPIRDRSYELVVTKPCTPEIWLGGHFLAGVQILALLTAYTLVAGALAFLLSTARLRARRSA